MNWIFTSINQLHLHKNSQNFTHLNELYPNPYVGKIFTQLVICCAKTTLSSYSLAVCSSFHPAIHCLHWKLNIFSKCAHEQVCGKCKTSTPIIFSIFFPFISCQTADGGREGGRASTGQPADDSTPARCFSEVFDWFSSNRPALHPQLITVCPAEPTALGERGERQARGSDCARMSTRTQEANDILALFWWTGMLVDLISILKDYSIPQKSEELILAIQQWANPYK